MRINQYVARATSLSRRKADQAILDNRVTINGQPAKIGASVSDSDKVELDHQPITPTSAITIALNKPVGYVCSRNGQGSATIYDLLPAGYHGLKTAGRLDKDSSGLLIMSNDGDLLQKLTHPTGSDSKIYEVELNKTLMNEHKLQIENGKVKLSDGVSQFSLRPLGTEPWQWEITMSEGRNRQIRRTFEQIGYQVNKLHRIAVGPYTLDDLAPGQTKLIH